MKKQLLSIAIICSILIFSHCSKRSIEPFPHDTGNNILCSLNTDVTFHLLTDNNKTWNIFYEDSISNTILNIPGLSSPTIPNTLNMQNYKVLEHNYVGMVIDTGSYIITDCGKVALLTTILSGGTQPFIINQLTYNNFIIYFKAPLGLNGNIITVKIVGTKQ